VTLSKPLARTLVKDHPNWRFAPLSTLSSPGYRFLWTASLLWNQARWMDRVVLGWVVFDMTDSAWNLAVLEAVRWLPLLLFGIAGGAIADRVDRRWVLIGAQGLAFIVCSISAVLLFFGLFDFTIAIFVTFALGVQWAVDWPTRRALIPDVVGRDLTMNAVALESVSQNVTRVVGPLVAGVLVAYVSAAAAFGMIAALYALEIVLLKLMPLAARPTAARGGSMLRYLSEGFAQLSSSQAIVGVLLVSVFMNVLVFPYQQLLPVFARDSLQVDAVGLGGLTASGGIGSVVGAVAIAMSRRVPHSGMVFCLGSCLMSLCLIGFAASQQYILALVLLAVSGMGQSAFASLQSTIVLGSSTDQMRGRAMGALTLAIGSTPFGSLELGALSVALGAPLAVALNAGLSALLVLLVALRLPRIRAV
jgi:MFS family permease